MGCDRCAAVRCNIRATYPTLFIPSTPRPINGTLKVAWEGEMKCPHCSITFHDAWKRGPVLGTQSRAIGSTVCPSCDGLIVQYYDGWNYRLIDPLGANRGPVPAEVPTGIAKDYEEACNVLPVSAKASAALSRRCLQAILRANGYKAKDLATEVDLLLAETDSTKAIPQALRTVIDGIRNFGNFSAHPITDITSPKSLTSSRRRRNGALKC